MNMLNLCRKQHTVAYPELVSRGVSERRKCKRLVKVGASNGVTPLIKKNYGRGGVSGQPENPPGYATGILPKPIRRQCFFSNLAIDTYLQIAMYIILGDNVNYVNLSSDIVAVVS